MRATALWLMATFALSAHAQLFKCEVNGKVQYQDAPCHDAKTGRGIGGAVSTVDALPQSEIDRTNARAARERARDAAAPKMTVIGEGRRGAPTAQDLKNLETAASSTTINAKEREFLQNELRRARAAHDGEGTYTEKDWRRLQEAQSAQNRINPSEREAARRDAEDVHLRKSSDARQAEVLQTRQAEEDRKNARRASAAAAAQQTERDARPRSGYCTGDRCWAGGQELDRGANNSYVGGSGLICSRNGNSASCN